MSFDPLAAFTSQAKNDPSKLNEAPQKPPPQMQNQNQQMGSMGQNRMSLGAGPGQAPPMGMTSMQAQQFQTSVPQQRMGPPGGMNQMNMMGGPRGPPGGQMGFQGQPPPGMQGMGGPPPQQQIAPVRQPLKIQLTGKERGFYSNMLSLADPQQNNKVGGKEAVDFFKKSGLPVDQLKEIWKVAARTSNAHLTKEEFYVALRLIAYKQNNIRADETSINMNIEVALPNFDQGSGPKEPPPLREVPEINSQEIANQLPDLDDLDLDQLDNVNSLIPSVDRKTKLEQQQQMAQEQQKIQNQMQNLQMQSQQNMMQMNMQNQNLAQMDQQQFASMGGMPPQQTESQWAITPDELSSFDRIFSHFDKNQSNSISDQEMQKIIAQTQLPREICAKVWQLINPEGADTFTKPQFFLAMQLMAKAKHGVPIPDQVPQELKQSIFMGLQQHQKDQMGGLVVQEMPKQPRNMEMPKPQFMGSQPPPQQESQNKPQVDDFLNLPQSQPQNQRQRSPSPAAQIPSPQNQSFNLLDGFGSQPQQNASPRISPRAPQDIMAPPQKQPSPRMPMHQPPQQQMNMAPPPQADILPQLIQNQAQTLSFLQRQFHFNQSFIKDINQSNQSLEDQIREVERQIADINRKMQQEDDGGYDYSASKQTSYNYQQQSTYKEESKQTYSDPVNDDLESFLRQKKEQARQAEIEDQFNQAASQSYNEPVRQSSNTYQQQEAAALNDFGSFDSKPAAPQQPPVVDGFDFGGVSSKPPDIKNDNKDDPFGAAFTGDFMSSLPDNKPKQAPANMGNFMDPTNDPTAMNSIDPTGDFMQNSQPQQNQASTFDF